MYRYTPYDGKKSTSKHRRRTSSSSAQKKDGPSRGVVKLTICIGLFVIASLMKLVFPAAFEEVGDKINAVVNYKAVFTVIGEGISGEKKFTAALSEAFTYAFTSESVQITGDGTDDSALDPNSGASPDPVDALTDGEAAEAFAENDVSPLDAAASQEVSDTGQTFADAVKAAFLQDQDAYSDYDIPAGVSYDMPRISMEITKPLKGEVSSPFGYRIHPTDSVVRFHYGTDIAADNNEQIVSFADGKVIAAGESTTLGKYIIISHGEVESLYAHCLQIFVTSGQAVARGDAIACVGDTGNATAPCLHLEIKVNGINVNPEYYITW